jgi:hypothetical protein
MKRIDAVSTNPRMPLYAGALLFLCFALSTAHAEGDMTQDARKAGRAVGEVMHDIGHGAKKVGKEIGQGARKVGKAVGDAAKEGFEALKEGGKEFKQALKGD